MFLDGLKHLEGCEGHGRTVDNACIDFPEFTEEIGGKFRLGFGLVDLIAIFEVFLMTALKPVGEALGREAAASIGQFVDDDLVGQSIVEHEVEHVSGGFGKAGYGWMMPACSGFWRGKAGARLHAAAARRG